MNSIVRGAGMLALALLAAVVFGKPAQAEVTLSFGVYATDSRADVEKQFRPALPSLRKT